MYTKTTFKTGFFLLGISLLSLAACKRDKDNTSSTLSNADDNGGYASDAAKMEQNSNDVISLADAAAASASGTADLRTTSTGCAVITNNTTVTPHILTIDFGTGCEGADLKTRKGEIIVSYSGNYKDSNSTHTITYNNYFVNNMQVMGNKTVTNMGTNSSGQVWYNVTVNDTLQVSADSMVTWTGSRTRTWLAGYSTDLRSDDVYAIGGTSVLTRANGHVFTYSILATDPLKIALSCPWIEAGTVTVSSPSFVGGNRILDYGYGTGGCDAKVQLTIGGHTYVITMW